MMHWSRGTSSILLLFHSLIRQVGSKLIFLMNLLSCFVKWFIKKPTWLYYCRIVLFFTESNYVILLQPQEDANHSKDVTLHQFDMKNIYIDVYKYLQLYESNYLCVSCRDVIYFYTVRVHYPRIPQTYLTCCLEDISLMFYASYLSKLSRLPHQVI